MNDPTPSQTVTHAGHRFQTIVGGIWVLLLLIIIVSSFFPVLGRNRQMQLGERANQNLEQLFRAKEAYAEELRIDSTQPIAEKAVQLTKEALLAHLHPDAQGVDCSPKGDYILGPLVDEFGEIVTPTHRTETHDPDGNGETNAAEGLFIHRRSHLQDPETGSWFRDPAFVFPK